jgi:A/G-specific adenine glycosylase
MSVACDEVVVGRRLRYPMALLRRGPQHQFDGASCSKGMRTSETPTAGSSERMASSMDPDTVWMRRRIRRWSEAEGRRLPWREDDAAPFQVLLAEVLLQRTRSDLVLPVYERFIARYPNSKALARASEREVASIVAPLGLAKRQPYLIALGRALVECHGGRVPVEREELLKLPLVGPYVAAAVGCLAFDRAEPMVDGGVVRVIRRAYGLGPATSRPPLDVATHEKVQKLLGRRPKAINLGLIDLSTSKCRRRPECASCVVRARCSYRLNQHDRRDRGNRSP